MTKTAKRSLILSIPFVLLIVAAGWLWSPFGRDHLSAAVGGWVMTETGRELSIDGGVSVRFWPGIGITLREAVLGNPPGFGEGPFAEMDLVDLRIRARTLLRGQVEVTAVRVDGVRLYLVRDEAGYGNWEDILALSWNGSSDAVGVAAARPDPGWLILAGLPPARAEAGDDPYLTVHEGLIDWRDRVSGREGQVTDVALTLAAPPAPGARVGWRLEQALIESPPIPRRRLAGEGTLTFDAFGSWIGPDPWHLRLDPPAAAEGVALELDAVVTAQMALGLYRFDDLVGTVRNLSDPAGAMPLIGRFDGHIEIEWPAAMPAPAADPAVSGRFTVADWRLAGLRATPAEVELTGRDGVLQLVPRFDDFYDGQLAGRLAIDVRDGPPRLALHVDGSGIQVGPLVADLAGTGWLAGTGDLRADLTAVGDTTALIRSTLNGEVALAVRDGALIGIDLAGLIADARARFEGRAAPVRDAPRTAFQALTASAQIQDGLLTNQDLVGHAEHLELTGRGRLDLVGERIDYRIEAVLVDPPAGSRLTELAGIPVPIRVRGSVMDPAWSVDLAPVAREIARRRLDERGVDLLKDLEGRLGIEGLERGLRDLIGR